MARLRSLQVSAVRRFSTTSALAAARRRGDSQLQAAALNASRPTTTSQSILFGTPLLRTDLMPQLGDAANTELSRVVRQTFFRASSQISADTQAAYRHEAALREGDENNPLASAANNEFFQHQIERLTELPTAAKSGVDLLLPGCAKTPAFATLARLVRRSAANYLMESYALSAEEAAALVGPRRMLLWASVHAGGSGHPYHMHTDSLVSGVYFADCPEGSGDFIAGSSMPPLVGEEYRVTPTAGTLLLFPSTMAHRIAPSSCDESRPRVSISFNIAKESGEHDAASARPASRVLLRQDANGRGLLATVEKANRSEESLKKSASAAQAALRGKAPRGRTAAFRHCHREYRHLCGRLLGGASWRCRLRRRRWWWRGIWWREPRGRGGRRRGCDGLVCTARAAPHEGPES